MNRLSRLKGAVMVDIRRNRELAYRRALIRAGYMRESVDIMVERDRDWIDNGGER